MKTLPIFLSVIAGLLFTSCASFERDWRQAIADYEGGAASTPAGPWIGEWTTTSNGHTGALRAIVTKVEGSSNEYDFRYHATWAKVLSGTYKVRYPVTGGPGRYTAKGEENLGLFGRFGHSASISNNSFNATYSNKKGDIGKFALKRPQ